MAPAVLRPLVCIIDDDPIWASTLALHLEHDFDFVSKVFKKTQSFVERIRERSFDPDALVIDIDFESVGEQDRAGLDLLDSLALLRSEYGCPRTGIPILLVTGRSPHTRHATKLAHNAESLGATFLVKSPEAMSGSIGRCIRDGLVHSQKAASDPNTEGGP